MSLIETFFWIGVLLVGYTYLGYPLILTLINNLIGKEEKIQSGISKTLPTVTVLIAAYNESNYIKEKITNTLGLAYDSNKLRIIVVTDGSSDNSLQILQQFSGIEVFHQDERRGKNHAVNRVLPFVTSEILVLTDANAMLNKEALIKLVYHFEDNAVGMVAGEKKLVAQKDNNAASGEGLYWRYESYLKRLDSRIGSTIGAAGELFAIRTHLMNPVPQGVIIEDFYASLQIIKNGFRIVYEPEAYAVETGSADIKEELKRKIRISAGGIQSVFLNLWLLNPFKFGIVSWQYVSHRALRWTIAPFTLPILLALNLFLVWQDAGIVYSIVFAVQFIIYIIALIGYLWNKQHVKNKFSLVIFYFIMMNYSVWLGALRLLRGKQTVVWEKAQRAD